jgi:hypothetical protein
MKEGGLCVKPIPVPSQYKHPKPKFDQLPTHEFTMGIIAPKGAGKTTLICNLLDFYKDYFHTILIYSPTILSDEKWDYVKQRKLLVENVPLKKWIKQMEEKKIQQGIVERDAAGSAFSNRLSDQPKFTGYIDDDCFHHEYDEDQFKSVMDEQKAMIDLLKMHGMPKYFANRILIIFDDLVGSSLFSGTRGNYFKGLNTRHRHYSASFLMVSQGYKEIPKTIRTNWTCLIVFEIGNEREVFVIYEEYAMAKNLKDWLECYRHAVSDDHGFLFLDYQKPKRMRMMKNFNEYLFTQNDEEEVERPKKKQKTVSQK